MANRLPPLNPLKAFEAAARLGSVSRAARELNVTHGAISHQVRSLEQTLNVKLLQRDGNRLKLTAQGAALLPSISQAFETISTAMSSLSTPSTEGDLVVSCVPALLAFWLVPRIAAFTEQFPGVRLRLIPSNEPSHVYDSNIDLCIRYGDQEWSDCWFRLFAHIDLFPVVSPTLLNKQPLRTVGELADHVLLHADDGREWQTWLAAADAPELSRARTHFLSDAHLAIEAATHGAGIALGDTMTASRLLSAGELIVPFELAVPATDAFFVVCRSEARTVPITRIFIDWLFAAVDEEYGKGHPTRRLRPAPAHRSGKGSAARS